jgi:ketosteroid isomerase-like protein
VLDSYPRFNAGESLATLVPQLFHPDAEYYVASEDPDSTVHRGIDAIRKHTENWIDAYPDLQIEPLEGKANGDQVFDWLRFVGHGASSGVPIEMKFAVPIEMKFAAVVTLHDGKFARVAEYYVRSEALKAVGPGGLGRVGEPGPRALYLPWLEAPAEG